MQSVKMGDFEDKKKVKVVVVRCRYALCPYRGYNSGPDELLRQRRADRKEHR